MLILFSKSQNPINKLNAGEQREAISIVIKSLGWLMTGIHHIELKREGFEMAKKKKAKKVKTVKPSKKAW
jgi:hypothetical protein